MNNKKIQQESIVLDEGTELLSREALRATNVALSKSFFIQRALGYLVIVNIPNFFMLDTVLRQHRVRTLIHITSRGEYKCITGRGIDIIADVGMKTKNINAVKIPNGTFWHGYFRKDFPKIIDRAEYEKLKMIGIDLALEKMKDDIVQKKMLPAKQAAQEIGCTPATIINMIKKQEIEGKIIGNKWYITRKSYEKLVTP